MDRTHALLGLMTTGPTHGYDLKGRYDALFGSTRAIAFGQIYSTIARLIRDGLIETLGSEPGAGPDRKRYEVTAAGREHLATWLREADADAGDVPSTVFAKTIIALMLDADADALLDVQRRALIARMRELTAAKAEAPLLDALAVDQALLRIDADLRWMDLTAARLGDLREEVRRHG